MIIIKDNELLTKYLSKSSFDINISHPYWLTDINNILLPNIYSIIQKSYGLISLSLDSQDINLIDNFIYQWRFKYIETDLIGRLDIKENERIFKFARTPLREAKEEDVPVLLEIAKITFKDNRFMLDNNTPKEFIKTYYNNWILDSFKNDRILVLDSNGVKGFMILRKEEDKIIWNLAGVAEEAKSGMIGTSLYAGTYKLMYEEGIKRCEVSYTANNLPVMNIFTLLGVKVENINLRFHKWGNL